MKFFEIVKDYFAPAYSNKFANSVEDSKILSQLAKDALFLRASNGKDYYYYFPKGRTNIGVAQYLLRRNGISAKKHNSKYYYEGCLVLRVPKNTVYRNAKLKTFIESIDVDTNYFDDDKLQLLLRKVCQQMKGNVK